MFLTSFYSAVFEILGDHDVDVESVTVACHSGTRKMSTEVIGAHEVIGA